MRISELSAATNETAHTLRFYEAEGLLPPPRRTPNGYRDYAPCAIDQVRFTRALQQAGLSLVDIATLVQRREATGPISSNDARLVASAQALVDHQLDALARTRARLAHRAAAIDEPDDRIPTDCTSISIPD